jgi:DNA-binding XRE family transcriptional regulator
MNKSEFSKIRHRLGKTQSQLGRLLGTSFKAIQSIEQDWRSVSAHTERQLLLLLALKSASGKKSDPCWVIRKCPPKIKQDCPAWEFRAGHLCWLINGTICQGVVQGSWKEKMKICRGCRVFRLMLPGFPRHLQGPPAVGAPDRFEA